MHQIKHSNTSRLSLHFKVLSQSYESFPTSPIRNAAHGSIISSTNITISAKGGRFYPIDLSGKPETAITTPRCEEQTGRVEGRSYKCHGEKNCKKIRRCQNQNLPDRRRWCRGCRWCWGCAGLLLRCRSWPVYLWRTAGEVWASSKLVLNKLWTKQSRWLMSRGRKNRSR